MRASSSPLIEVFMNVYSGKRPVAESAFKWLSESDAVPVNDAGKVWQWLTGEGLSEQVSTLREREAEDIQPFTNHAYGPQMILNKDRTKDLTDAITAVKATLSAN